MVKSITKCLRIFRFYRWQSIIYRNIGKLKRLGRLLSIVNGRAFKPTEWEELVSPIIRIQNLNKPETVYNYTKQDI